MAQFGSLGHFGVRFVFFALYCDEDSGDSFFQMTVLAEFESVGSRAGRRGNSMRHVFEDHRLWPNKTLQPTPVGVFSSAIAVHLTGPAWLSFSR